MATLALSMIVRNEEAVLPRCLESVRGIADEIVIADTGSTDQTMQIARHFGARVFSIPWENDFACARNQALAEVHSDWVLALDADEMLDPGATQTMADHMAKADIAGYQVPIWNYTLRLSDHLWDRPAKPNRSSLAAARQYPAYVEHENVRLFRRLPEIYFVGRVHETVGTRILETGMKLGHANLVIHHFGMVAEAEVHLRKHILYLEMGREKVREMPNDAQAHFELGLEEFKAVHNDSEALRCFRRACELDPRFNMGWVFSGLTLMRMGRPAEAVAALKRAEEGGYHTALVTETLADGLYDLGDFRAARRYYERALKRSGYSPGTENKLGLTEIRLGRTGAGLTRMRRAIEREPKSGELYDRLVTALVWLGRLDEAAEVAERRLAATDVLPASFLRAASIRAQRRDWQRAREVLQLGLDQFPSAETLRQAIKEVVSRSRM
jgi:tetratricopeptide (TPR) repeat protein